uniref:Uncharacterized protein n=1 Tax=Noccaea caerulescens TaxID=107243 RepID=A0A1J3JC21_NOCCA
MTGAAAEWEGDDLRAVLIAEARPISTQMSSSSIISVFLTIQTLFVSLLPKFQERETETCDIFLLTFDHEREVER